jgi:hypothetical protein
MALLRQWLEHPVTEFLLAKIREESKALKITVLYDEVPGLFDARFLLREQNIGEQRGLERPQSIVEDKLTELINSEKTDETNENTTQSE